MITITGNNFTGATKVQVNGLDATDLHVVSDTQVTAKVPTGALRGKLTVVKPGHGCPRGTVSLNFNQQGKNGRRGATGKQGPPKTCGSRAPVWVQVLLIV